MQTCSSLVSRRFTNSQVKLLEQNSCEAFRTLRSTAYRSSLEARRNLSIHCQTLAKQMHQLRMP